MLDFILLKSATKLLLFLLTHNILNKKAYRQQKILRIFANK